VPNATLPSGSLNVPNVSMPGSDMAKASAYNGVEGVVGIRGPAGPELDLAKGITVVA
jgi:hypothetical protein